jgi:hypothetical protein
MVPSSLLPAFSAGVALAFAFACASDSFVALFWRTMRTSAGARSVPLPRGCGKRSALVVHHRSRHNQTNLLVTLCVRCHIRIHRSSGLRYWFSEMLVRLWRELHPSAPMRLQLSFRNADKTKRSKVLFKESGGKVLSVFDLPNAPSAGLMDTQADPRSRVPRS